jgi:hypothetical protein
MRGQALTSRKRKDKIIVLEFENLSFQVSEEKKKKKL